MKKLIICLVLVAFAGLNGMGYPKTDVWNGVAHAVKEYMAKHANDPKSVEYIDSSVIIEFTNGMYSQLVEYRAKNGFGGLVVTKTIFFMEGDGYEAKVVATGTVAEVDKMLQSGKLVVKEKYPNK